MAMTMKRIGGAAMRGNTRARCPDWFKTYMLDGDYWRAGKRVAGELARFAGLALHRSGGGTDGQEGAQQFTAPFMSFLEQSRVQDQVAKDLQNTAVNRSRVQKAMRDIVDDRPDEMRALEFYLVPQERRSMSVQARALAWDMSPDKLRDDAKRGVELVWEELGGIWAGEQPYRSGNQAAM